jgi:hypothetical protein
MFILTVAAKRAMFFAGSSHIQNTCRMTVREGARKMTLEQKIWEEVREKKDDGIWRIKYVMRSSKYPNALLRADVIVYFFLLAGLLYQQDLMPLRIKIAWVAAYVLLMVISTAIFEVLYPRVRAHTIQSDYLAWLRDELRKSLADLRAKVGANPTEEGEVSALRRRLAQHMVVKLVADDTLHGGLKAVRIPDDDEFNREVNEIVETMVPFPLSELIKDLES